MSVCDFCYINALEGHKVACKDRFGTPSSCFVASSLLILAWANFITQAGGAALE